MVDKNCKLWSRRQ